MNPSKTGKLALGPLSGHWYRCINLRHWKTRLSTSHSASARSRFSATPPTNVGYRLLYLGENHQVVVYEVGALLGPPEAPISNPTGSWLLLSLDVRLDHVADLSDSAQQKIIATNDQELTGTWPNASSATPTQRLGAALHAVPLLEGVIVPSSKPGGGRNLVVFPEKLGPRSSVSFWNELLKHRENLT